MTTEEIRSFFGSTYKFHAATGMSRMTFNNWLTWGYVPFKAQFRLQELSKGKLVARLEDGVKK